jgi:type I restriction enzyme S subunit
VEEVGEICQINRGRVMSKDYLRNNAGEYPVYSSQTVDDGVFGRINTYDYDGEYLTWTTDGANAGSIFYRNGKFSITNVCGLLKVKVDGVNTKFLLYILATVSKQYVSAGMGNPKIMSNVMEKILIPLPPHCHPARDRENSGHLYHAGGGAGGAKKAV